MLLRTLSQMFLLILGHAVYVLFHLVSMWGFSVCFGSCFFVCSILTNLGIYNNLSSKLLLWHFSLKNTSQLELLNV